jgi:probable F420-dependent oxidoreductase
MSQNNTAVGLDRPRSFRNDLGQCPYSAEEDVIKVDGGLFGDLTRVSEAARALEQQGYHGCWTGEINHDPFLSLLLAAEHTSRLELGTSIAVAFARNPMTVANLGWDLQNYSRGRFILGLGTQIKPHIEKRFSMPWSHPVRRMREFVLALHAIWSAWQDGSRLRFEGEFYTHKLMTPMFTPEPQPYPVPKVFIAVVGEAMTEMCGEVADGMLAHAFTTRRYLHEVTMPALQRGIQRSGRDRREFEVACPAFIVTGDDEADRLLRFNARLPEGSRASWLVRRVERAASVVAAR